VLGTLPDFGLSLVQVTETNVVLFSIYNKGDKDDISDKEIQKLIDDLE
jgi:hypothetical protein